MDIKHGKEPRREGRENDGNEDDAVMEK